MKQLTSNDLTYALYEAAHASVYPAPKYAPTTLYFLAAREIERLMREKTKAQMSTCNRTQNEDGNWETGCGQMFVFEAGTPEDNKFEFCCYCGNSLQSLAQLGRM